MATVGKDTSVRVWSFHCSECGFGDTEFGHLAADDDIYCELCLAEGQLFVRLHRWTDVEAAEQNTETAIAA
ncbi:MAG: hypothetical protein M3Y41_11060 [Pseudomonadota bacterium]|nr:hypothetical protein [Pseudomonadota bacterium]